jgi:hypothetical protein
MCGFESRRPHRESSFALADSSSEFVQLDGKKSIRYARSDSSLAVLALPPVDAAEAPVACGAFLRDM